MGIAKFLFGKIAKLIAAKGVYVTKSLSYRSKPQKVSINYDYIRYSTLGLCYERIIENNVKGNVAELGVYQGNFSSRLNQLFKDRKLYLFDTFEGFDNRDVSVEKENNFSKGTQDFSNTSVELVMDKMTYQNNCVIKKGFFPESASDVSDRFCFVSIDADLYEPIYSGLSFFYPRLEKGGYIFVHDYNNELYKGAKIAVEEFCSKFDINYVPIPDGGGTIIITK